MPSPTPRQVNLALELLVVGAILTGLTSWAIGDPWSGVATFLHGAIGIALALLVPAKLRGSVRTGFKRRRATRRLSAAFGVLVLATLLLGFVHATGLWYGVGHWSALWTHELFGFAVIPLLVWHVVTRPVRPARRDIDRRAILRLGLLAGVAGGLHVGQRATAGLLGLAGGDRRSTGSHEVGSHDPSSLPSVTWLDDRTPSVTDADGWPLRVDGEEVSIASLAARTTPVTAIIDCTGGWWSEQVWDAVPLAELVADAADRGRSVAVRSATGYERRFAADALHGVYLAVGYGGEALRARHGAPVRLVVPGRRGPEWVKWVVEVRVDDRPAWLQLPLPLS